MQADKQPFLFSLVGTKDHRGILTSPGIVPQRLRIVIGGIYLFVGTMSLISGVWLLYWRTFHNAFLGAAIVFLLLAGIVLPLSLRFLWIWRKLRTVMPLDVCSRQFGITTNCLHELVVEHGIRPQINVAGQDYFSLKDFGDISTLLRASNQPLTSQDTLLRPVVSIKEAKPEQLLRTVE